MGMLRTAKMSGIPRPLPSFVEQQQSHRSVCCCGADGKGLEHQLAIEHDFEAHLASVVMDLAAVAGWPDKQQKIVIPGVIFQQCQATNDPGLAGCRQLAGTWAALDLVCIHQRQSQLGLKRRVLWPQVLIDGMDDLVDPCLINGRGGVGHLQKDSLVARGGWEICAFMREGRGGLNSGDVEP